MFSTFARSAATAQDIPSHKLMAAAATRTVVLLRMMAVSYFKFVSKRSETRLVSGTGWIVATGETTDGFTFLCNRRPRCAHDNRRSGGGFNNSTPAFAAERRARQRAS